MYNVEGSMWLKEQFLDLQGTTVLEFGNQHIWEHAKATLGTQYDVARDWFCHQMKVAEYVSMDINGEDGSLFVDLGEDIPFKHRKLLNYFDIVTNIGSTEHFGKEPERQWKAFCNAVRFAKVGGTILHQLVPAGQWLDHCDVWYKDGIGHILAAHTGCYLIEEKRVNLAKLNPEVDYICAALWKYKDGELPTEPPEDFVRKLSW